MGAPGAHYILDDDARARPVSRGLPELTAIRLDTRADGDPSTHSSSPRTPPTATTPRGRARTCASAPAAAGRRGRPPIPAGHLRRRPRRAPTSRARRARPARRQIRPATNAPTPSESSGRDASAAPRLRRRVPAHERRRLARHRLPDPTAARTRARRPSSAVRGAGKPQRSRGPDAVGARRVEHFPRAERVDVHSRASPRGTVARPPTPERAEAKRPGDGDGDGDAATAPSRAGRPRGKNVGPGPGPASRRGKPPAAEKRRRYAALRASLTEALTRVKTSVDAEAVKILESAVSAGRAAGTDAAPWIATPLADAEAVPRQRTRQGTRAPRSSPP